MTDFSIYEELMPKIKALITPPNNSNAGTSKEKYTLDSHPHFKRRGKRHNHDYCDACGEKGSVVLCANCPASFHLLCHDPPLNEKEVVSGQWFCNACQYTRRNRNKLTMRPTDSNDSLEESAETSTFSHPSTSPAKSSMCSFQSLSNKNVSLIKEDVLSVSLHDSIIIKNESFEEQNVGSELEESSDDATNVENVCVKTECNDEDPSLQRNLEFPVKTEPETDGHDSAPEHGTGDVNDLNMDDVWKILGIDNRVKINTIKESKRKTSANSDTGVSKNSSDLDIADIIETVKRKQIHVNLTNCDYMLKDRRSSAVVADTTKLGEKKKVSVTKPKRNQRKSSISAINHATEIKKAFSDIIRDSSKINPKQFTLPNDYIKSINLNLIGTEKESDNFPNDLDSRDLLKLPARKCYYCKGTCLVGQMISCDFCPAHFHLNCLNPPLCNIPDVKWMCPLHPHHVLERVMKNPSSVTELMSWWSKFSVPIDDEDVKTNFINKVKSLDKKLTDRRIIRSSVKIPDIVKYHYKHPPTRIPPLEELVGPRKSPSIFNNDIDSLRSDLNGKMNNRCFSAQEPAASTSTPCDEPQTREITGSVQKNVSTSETNNITEKKYNLRPYKKAKWKHLLDLVPEQRNTSKNSSSNEKKIQETDSGQFSSTTISTNEFTCSSSSELRNERAPEILRKQVDTGETNLSWKKIENYVVRDINRNFITGGISITTLSEDIRRILMLQKIKQLTEDLPPSFTPNTNPYPLFHPLLKDNINDTLPDRPKGNVRAVLCPLSHRPLIYMYGPSLSIGADFSNDICLRNYGNCNFISEDHAVIFHDKVTNTYELINYSEYSTVVDGVCYTCDISRNTYEKSIETIKKSDESTPVEAVSKPLKKKSAGTSSSISCNIPSKRAGSTVMAAETRNTYKKLLHDIDKLVSKSQQEMAAIAAEDLNEISKAIKNAPTEIKTNQDIQIGKKRVQRTKRVANKRKTIEISDDLKSPKIPRKTKPVSRLIAEDEEDTTRTNEEQKSPRVRPNAKAKLTKPQKRVQITNRRRTWLKRTNKTKRTKPLNEEITLNDNSCPSDPHTDNSDDEYLPVDNLFVNPKRSPCRCQSNHQKFPNGRDSSWERTAPLNHGSYIQFGCVEFIFSIVNYPPPAKDRPYIAAKAHVSSNPSREHQEPSQTIPEVERKDDLTMKLMSLLNIISSKTSENSPNAFADQQSSPPSSLSSRSHSPILQNGHSSERSESPKTPEAVEGQIEITG